MKMADIAGAQMHEVAGGRIFTNRTGAATVVGAPYVQDVKTEDGDSGSIGAGINNLLVATSARTATDTSPLVIADQAVADNEECRCLVPSEEGTLMRVRVEGTADILKGSKLVPDNANGYFVLQGTPANGWYAIALEGFTTNDVGYIQAIVFRYPKAH